MKKHWIFVKRGLSEDPKHRAAMGECVWLFLHILDRADFETGIVIDWKDGQEAADMGMPIETLRHQRQKLQKLDYIRCNQKQHGLEITIMEWRNPRDYGNEVKNPRFQGSRELPPSIQGSNQGSNQVPSQPATPTSNSISYPKKKGDIVDAIIESSEKAQYRILATEAFEQAFGVQGWPWDSTGDWEAFTSFITNIYAGDKDFFKRYVEWRNGEGRFKGAMTNIAIRKNPKTFIDTGWPTFLASNTMYISGSSPERKIPLVKAEENPAGITMREAKEKGLIK